MVKKVSGKHAGKKSDERESRDEACISGPLQSEADGGSALLYKKKLFDPQLAL